MAKSVMVTLLLGHIGMFVVLESIKLHFEHSQERPPLMLLCYRDVFHSVSFLKLLFSLVIKSRFNQLGTTMNSVFFTKTHSYLALVTTRLKYICKVCMKKNPYFRYPFSNYVAPKNYKKFFQLDRY